MKELYRGSYEILKKGYLTMNEKNSLNFGNLDEIFDFAIEKEKEAWEFYTEWADKADKKAMKEAFEEFALEEKKHVKLFEDLKAGHSVDVPEKKEIDFKVTNYFIEVTPYENMSYEDALRLAIQREKAAIELYTEFASHSPSPEITSVLELLINEETKHKVILETLYEEHYLPEN